MTKTKNKKPSRAEALVRDLNATLGTDVRLGSDDKFAIRRIPTGSLTLDRITGGGFVRGRHIELYGDESACKSYIMYRAMALAQRRGELCAIIDPEHSFDFKRFKSLGGRPKELIVSHPKNAEEAIAVMMTLSQNADDLSVVGIDSVASMIPAEEMAKDPREEDRIAGQARMMSRALRRLTAQNETIVFLWTNQEYTNVGIRFGNPKSTRGGRALRYYATTRIEMRRGTIIKAKRRVANHSKMVERDVPVGRWIQCRVEKDKSTRPYREGSFEFDGETGRISEASEIIQLGLQDGIIDRVGNNFTYVDLGDRTWKGTEKKFKLAIKKNDELREELVSLIEEETKREGVNGA